MITRQKTLNVEEVRRRAAEIRRHWSPLEKLRRTGLPPDMPPKLRQYFLGSPQRAWCIASDAGYRKAGPLPKLPSFP
jgi:hypothetical protein